MVLHPRIVLRVSMERLEFFQYAIMAKSAEWENKYIVRNCEK